MLQFSSKPESLLRCLGFLGTDETQEIKTDRQRHSDSLLFLLHPSLLPQMCSASPREDRTGGSRTLHLWEYPVPIQLPLAFQDPPISPPPDHSSTYIAVLHPSRYTTTEDSREPVTPPHSHPHPHPHSTQWKKLRPRDLWEGKGGRCPRGGRRRH